MPSGCLRDCQLPRDFPRDCQRSHSVYGYSGSTQEGSSRYAKRKGPSSLFLAANTDQADLFSYGSQSDRSSSLYSETGTYIGSAESDLLSDASGGVQYLNGHAVHGRGDGITQEQNQAEMDAVRLMVHEVMQGRRAHSDLARSAVIQNWAAAHGMTIPDDAGNDFLDLLVSWGRIEHARTRQGETRPGHGSSIGYGSDRESSFSTDSTLMGSDEVDELVDEHFRRQRRL